MKKYSYFIGIAVFIFILWRIDLKKTITIIGQINLTYFLLAFLLVFLSFLIKIYRWNYIQKAQGVYYKFKDSFAMNMSSYVIGMITPGQIGELGKFMYLKKDGHSTSKAVIGVFLDRIFDIALLIFWGIIGLFLFFGPAKEIIWLSALILATIAVTVLFVKNKRIRNRFLRIIAPITPKKYRNSLQSLTETVINEMKKLSFGNYVFVTLLSAISWVFFFFQADLLMKAIGVTDIPFAYIALAATIARFISLIPISILGLGTREGTLLVLLAPYYISPESVVSFSFLIALTMLMIGFIGLFFWFKKPIPVR